MKKGNVLMSKRNIIRIKRIQCRSAGKYTSLKQTHQPSCLLSSHNDDDINHQGYCRTKQKRQTLKNKENQSSHPKLINLFIKSKRSVGNANEINATTYVGLHRHRITNQSIITQFKIYYSRHNALLIRYITTNNIEKKRIIGREINCNKLIFTSFRDKIKYKSKQTRWFDFVI